MYDEVIELLVVIGKMVVVFEFGGGIECSVVLGCGWWWVNAAGGFRYWVLMCGCG